MQHTILVYGTLRPFKNDDIVLVSGKLYDLGWYPGVILGNATNNEESTPFVTCERITADDERLAELDRYEGYDEEYPAGSLYLRKKVRDEAASSGWSWIYVYNRDVSGYRVIESGDWEKHKALEKEY